MWFNSHVLDAGIQYEGIIDRNDSVNEVGNGERRWVLWLLSCEPKNIFGVTGCMCNEIVSLKVYWGY